MKKYIPEYLFAFITLFVLVAFIPPFAYRAGVPKVGDFIHKVYIIFCHQRVERSLFILFGDEGVKTRFYTLRELNEANVIPDRNPKYPGSLGNVLFGYPYVGNEDVGYKIAFCSRDLALYSFMVLAVGIYLVYSRKTGKTPIFNWKILLLLMSPMILDVAFQMSIELFDFGFLSTQFKATYVNDIAKRFVTGALFGVGFGLLIFQYLKENTDFIVQADNDEEIQSQV